MDAIKRDLDGLRFHLFPRPGAWLGIFIYDRPASYISFLSFSLQIRRLFPPFTLFLCVVVVVAVVVGCGPHPAVNYHLTGELPL